MNKQELLEAIKQARATFLDAIDGLPDDAMLRPGVVGMWSVKDVLAHLTIWQSELITALAHLDRSSSEPTIVQIEDINGFNDEQYRANVRRGMAVILDDFHGVHKHLIKAIEALDEKTLGDGRKFPWMEGEPLSYLIAENSYLHEQEHADDIRHWRTEQEI